MSIELKLKDFVPIKGFKTFEKRNPNLNWDISNKEQSLIDNLKIYGVTLYHFEVCCIALNAVAWPSFYLALKYL